LRKRWKLFRFEKKNIKPVVNFYKPKEKKKRKRSLVEKLRGRQSTWVTGVGAEKRMTGGVEDWDLDYHTIAHKRGLSDPILGA